MDNKIKTMGLRSNRCRFSHQIAKIITTMLMVKEERWQILRVVLHQESKNSAKILDSIRLKHLSWFLVTWKTQVRQITTSMLRHNWEHRRILWWVTESPMLVLWDQLQMRVAILSLMSSHQMKGVLLNQLGYDIEMAWNRSLSWVMRPL